MNTEEVWAEDKPEKTHFQQREIHAESFHGLARKPLEEERKRIIERIIQTESIPTTQIKPEEKEDILKRLWNQRRDTEAKMRLAID